MSEIHFTNFYLHVLTTKDNVGNSSSRKYTIYIARLKIGDYVKYTPDTPNTGYNLTTTKSGYSSAQTIDKMYDPSGWRIMELDELGNITKLFGNAGDKQSVVWFQGTTGYANGVYLLNDICKTRYSNASLGATAKSLSIENIEAEMSEAGIAARNSYKSGETQYGTTRKYTLYTQYPAVYTQEKYSGVGISDIADGTQIVTGNVNNNALSKMNPNGKNRSDVIYDTLPSIPSTAGPAVLSLTCTQTHYYFSNPSSIYYKNENFYNMLFKNGRDYWIASRYVDCNSGWTDAYFGFFWIKPNYLSQNLLFRSNGIIDYGNHCLAPVVSFDSKITVNSGNGTINNPYTIKK